MQWTVQLEARSEQGAVTTAELLTFSRPAIVDTLAEAKTLLTGLQASMLCAQLAEYAAVCRVCPACAGTRSRSPGMT